MKVFMSYRREDSPGQAGRLRDALRHSLGAHQVFMDLDSIPSGARFANRIDDAVAACDAVLVLIGPGWLDARDVDGGRRLEDPNDWVRNEVVAGLRSDKPLLPILVGNASLPKPEELPEAMRPLVEYNAAEITEKRWDYDVKRLLNDLRALVHGNRLDATREFGRKAAFATLRRPRSILPVLCSWRPRRLPQSSPPGGSTSEHVQRFSVTGVPVTFTYPLGWGKPTLNASQQWQVGPNRASGLFVSPGAPNTNLKGDYTASNVTRGVVSHGGSLTVLDADLLRLGYHQRSWIFAAHGGTWSINCYWDAAAQGLVEPACASTLASVKVMR